MSRAELMDRRAMIENLNNGKIGKLGLDVYYEEPNSAEDPLINHPNFLVRRIHLALTTPLHGTRRMYLEYK